MKRANRETDERQRDAADRSVIDSSRAVRVIYFVAGLLLTGTGIVGAFLPLLPTTIFLILAAGCFSRSSPRLEAYLLAHPQFGPSLRNWRRSGAIAPRAKRAAFLGMAFGYILFYLGASPGLPLSLLVAGFMICCAAYVATRPNA